MSPRTPAGDVFSALVVKILCLNGLLTAQGDSLSKASGESSARWRILASLEDRPRTVADIARAWKLARQSVQRLADALTRDGLTHYQDNPHHQRAKLLALTTTGRKTLSSIQAEQRQWADRLGAVLGEKALGEMDSTLQQLITALEQQKSPRRKK